MQGLDRYAYVNNNPLRYIDPSGHKPCWATRVYSCKLTQEIVDREYAKYKDKDKSAVAAFFKNHGFNVTNKPSARNGDSSGGGNTPTNSSNSSNPTACTGLNCMAMYHEDSDITFSNTTSLPPPRFACEWIDCALSGASLILSLGTFPGMPVEIAAPAFVLDVLVTGAAVLSTNDAYNQGKITQVNQYALNITGIAGAIPGTAGLGFSLVNFLFTMTGWPH